MTDQLDRHTLGTVYERLHAAATEEYHGDGHGTRGMSDGMYAAAQMVGDLLAAAISVAAPKNQLPRAHHHLPAADPDHHRRGGAMTKVSTVLWTVVLLDDDDLVVSHWTHGTNEWEAFANVARDNPHAILIAAIPGHVQVMTPTMEGHTCVGEEYPVEEVE